MKRIIKMSSLIFLVCFFLWQTALASAKEINKFQNKIAFLQNGDIWIVTKDGSEKKQLTTTDGKVGDFLFSPSLRYLAYSKKIKYLNEPGIFEGDEDWPKRPVYSIVIVDMRNQKIKKEITPPVSPNNNWIYMDMWFSDAELVFHSSDGFGGSWYFVYDPIKNSIEKKDDANEIYRLFVKEYEILNTVEDILDKKAISPRYRGKENITLSFNKEYVAWLEFDHKVNDESIYTLQIYNFKSEAKVSYKDIAMRGNLLFSPNDKYLCIFDKYVERETVTVELLKENIHKIKGKGFHWISNNEVIYVEGTNLYLYDLEAKESKLFIKNAEQPVFLQQN